MSAGSDLAAAGDRLRPRILTTREAPGRLDSLLAAGGADAVHVALITTERLVDPGEFTDRLAAADWIAVTSRNGAAVVVEALSHRGPSPDGTDRLAAVRLAAVGRRTAEVLARSGLPVSVVPDRQTAADLVAAFPDPARGSVVVVRAERTEGVLVDGLRRRGFLVDEIVGYRTVARRPSARELDACRSADVVTFASGSAVASWASLDVDGPIPVAIGPSTAARAESLGVHVERVAAEHSVEGLAVAALAAAGRHP